MESKVKAPAIALMVAASLSALIDLLSLAMNILGTGFGAIGGGAADERLVQMFSGGLGIALALIGLAVQGFVFFGALKMMNLQSYGLALAAAIVACIPCFTCCCWNVPAGVWALIVLLTGDTKALFTA